jgi:hypothetical protein
VQESPGESTVAVTGKNVYVAWHTNKTANGNEEIFLEHMMMVENTFGA